MTPEQYRAKWNLPSTHPMVAPNYTAQRSALAKNIGLGLREKPIAAPSASAAAIEAVTDTIEVIAPEPASVRDRDGCGEVGERRHDRGGYGRHQAQSQAKSKVVAAAPTVR